MNLHFKIEQPCSASWNEMLPGTEGKQCALCNKEVIDLTLLTEEEILMLYVESGSKLCGRMNHAQLKANYNISRAGLGLSSAAALSLLSAPYLSYSSSVDPFEKNSWHISDEQLNVGFRISGTVKDENGKAISDAKIIVISGAKAVAQCTAISNGRYSIQLDLLKLHAPMITLVVVKSGYKSYTEEMMISKTHHLEKDIRLTEAINAHERPYTDSIIELEELNVVEERDHAVIMGAVSTHIVVNVQPEYEHAEENEASGIKMNTLFVYPNPVSDQVNIKMEIDSEYTLQIFSMEGKVLVDRPFTGNSTVEDVSHFMPGNYIAHVLNEKAGVMYSSKLTVMR